MAEWKSRRRASGQSDKKVLGVTSCLSVVNVFGAKYARFAHGHKSHHDNEMLKLIIEQGQRAQAQCVCMLYEAFERFIKDLTPLIFYQQRNESGWEPEERKAFHNSTSGMASAGFKNTLPYFTAYVEYMTKYNCEPLLTEIGKKMPDFKAACTTDWFAELFAVYRAVACIRHTTVHRAGQPSTNSMRKLQKWDRDLVKQLTKPSVLTGEDTILPTATATAVLFEGMAGLGYCLYKTSSDLCGMAVRQPRK